MQQDLLKIHTYMKKSVGVTHVLAGEGCLSSALGVWPASTTPQWQGEPAGPLSRPRETITMLVECSSRYHAHPGTFRTSDGCLQHQLWPRNIKFQGNFCDEICS